MGWAVGSDLNGRDIGYGVSATCDHPGCGRRIDRGLGFVCGSEPWGGEHGCGLFFCHGHRSLQTRGDDCPQLCDRCSSEEPPFEPTPDVPEWVNHKLTDETWEPWRRDNPEAVAALKRKKPAERGLEEKTTMTDEDANDLKEWQAPKLTVGKLREMLAELDPNLRVVKPWYAGGYVDAKGVTLVWMRPAAEWGREHEETHAKDRFAEMAIKIG